MRILYVNAIMTEAGGEIFARGTYEGLKRAKVAQKEGLEFIPYNMFYRENFSPVAMASYAQREKVDAIVLSGSEKNTTDSDDPWVRDYLRGLKQLLNIEYGYQDWSGPTVPIFGICFGHQALACAMGGETSRFSRKVDSVSVNALPHAYSHPIFRDKLEGRKNLEVIVTHSDHVVRIPTGFHQLFTSDYCVVQGMAHDQWPVVSMQAHPEITAALKEEPEEEADWRHLSLQAMNGHDGPGILASFADWAHTRC